MPRRALYWFYCVKILVVRRRVSAVSNDEARWWSSFEMLTSQALQNEGIERFVTQQCQELAVRNQLFASLSSRSKASVALV